MVRFSSHKRRVSLIVLIIALAILVSYKKSRQPKQYTRYDQGRFRVREVIDGDTIILSNGEKVRYLGIDTAERNEPFYEAAKRRNQDLVDQKEVLLQFDIEQRDRYGRLLAYVYLGDGSNKFVNGILVAEGLATTIVIHPNKREADKLQMFERLAQSRHIGIWKQNGEAR